MKLYSFFDFFPTPKFLEMPAPGLSLSTGALRLVEFAHGKNGLTIKQWNEERFPKELLVSGNITNPQELTKILEDFRKKNNLHHIRATLPEERAYLFSTVIASASGGDLRTNVEFTIEENVPISLAEAVFDYTVVAPEELDGKPGFKVSVSVIPEQVASEYLTMFRSAGFEPLHFEIESQAIIKAVTPKDDTTVCLIVNLAPDKAGLYVSDRGAVNFTSTIATTPFTNSAPEEKDLSYKEDGQENIKPAEESQALKEISEEIRKILLYWQAQSDRKNESPRPISRIILVGEEGGRRGVPEYLTGKFGITAEVANVWQNAFSLGNYIPGISKKDSLAYAAAVGLALPHGR